MCPRCGRRNPSPPSPQLDLTSLDGRVRSLLARLAAVSQDTSAQLEQTIHDITRTVPRLTYDLQFMRESAASLRLSLHAVEAKAVASSSSADDGAARTAAASDDGSSSTAAAAPDSDTLAVLDRLAYLDTVKTGMEATLAVLVEAESWSSLESEVTSLLAEAAFGKAAARLEEASRSVLVFTHNTTEYEARRSLLLSLQNQLEASLSAALVKAIGDKDKEACRSFFGIFSLIQREGEFRNYYYGSRRSAVVDLWTKAQLLDCEHPSSAAFELAGNRDVSPANQQPFATFLSQFFSALLALIAEERSLLPAIFPDPQPTLSFLIQSTFDALVPSLPQRLESLAEFHGPAALPELIRAFKATEDLGVNIQATLDKLGFAPTFAASPSPAAQATSLPAPGSGAGEQNTIPHTVEEGKGSISKRESRRYSRRMTAFSISVPRMESLDPNGAGGGGGGGSSGGPWESSLYEPFLDFQSEYPALEKRLLWSQLDREMDAAAIPGKTAGVSSSSASSEGVDSARVVWERAVAVFQLSEAALDRCLAFTHGYGALGLVGVINDLFDTFFDRCGEVFKDAGRRQSENKSTAADDETDELDGMDYSQEDWTTFQLALHLLGTCRGIQERLVAFDSKLTAALAQVAQAFLAARDDPTGLFVAGTTRGAISLLQQSSLNSKELYELFERLSSHSTFPSSVSLLKAPSFFPAAATASLQVAPSGAIGSASQLSALSSSSSALHLLGAAQSSLAAFTSASQLFLQQTILLPLNCLLATYPKLSIWAPIPSPSTTSGPSGERRSKKAAPPVVPTFSLAPTDVVSRVGEGLLNLPRLFEIYSDNDALAFSMETLPFIDLEGLRELVAEAAGEAGAAAASGVGGAAPAPPVGSPSGISPLASPTSNLPPPPPLAGGSSRPSSLQAAAHLSPETVTSLHLSSLTLSLLSHLTTAVLPSFAAPLPSPQAVSQLASDLGYLVNVVRVLDVDWSEGDEWREALEAPEEELRRQVEATTEGDGSVSGGGGGGGGEKGRLLRRVAELRGLSNSSKEASLTI